MIKMEMVLTFMGGQHCMFSLTKLRRCLTIFQLQRHGGRFPTFGALIEILFSAEKLKAARPYSDPKLLFLNEYECKLGSETLVDLGAEEYVDIP